MGAGSGSARVRDLLRASFAQELSERLPRIAAHESVPCEGEQLEDVRRDVHTLASSAWVVEEQEIARLARAVEDDLAGGPVTELVDRLRAWTP